MYGLFDAHCDTVCKAYETKQELFESNLHLDLKRLLEFDSSVQFFALWLDKKYLSNAYEETVKRINYYYKQVEKNKNCIRHCNSFDDIIKTKNEKKLSGILSIEGGEALEGDINKLYTFYNMGVRAMTLTWNYKNEIASGAGEKTGGVTDFGFEVIKTMEKLGMVVDVSHLNDESFWQVAGAAQKPFIASHSNSRKTTNVKRNLTDAQLKAVANAGGVVGLNLCPIFLSRKIKADINDILGHIDHIIKVVGVDYIGLGCDFDGIDDTPLGVENILGLKVLIGEIINKFGENTAKKICEENFMRLMAKLW